MNTLCRMFATLVVMDSRDLGAAMPSTSLMAERSAAALPKRMSSTLLPERNLHIPMTTDTSDERHVATPAPTTPRYNPYISSGSSSMLATAADTRTTTEPFLEPSALRTPATTPCRMMNEAIRAIGTVYPRHSDLIPSASRRSTTGFRRRRTPTVMAIDIRTPRMMALDATDDARSLLPAPRWNAAREDTPTPSPVPTAAMSW